MTEIVFIPETGLLDSDILAQECYGSIISEFRKKIMENEKNENNLTK
jgi:hypothetical protein